MNILPFLHFFVFLVYSCLLVFLLWKDPKSLLNRVCSALLACFVVWSFSYIFVHNLDTSKDTAILFDNIASMGWISFANFFLWFALIFAEKKNILKTRMIYPLIFILPLLFIYKQWTGFLTADYIQQPWGWESVWSDSIWAYLFFLCSLLFLAIGLYLILNFGRKTEEPIKKKQARIIFVAALVSVFISTLTDIMLPVLDIHRLPSLANVFALIWVSGMVYAIVKYKLMVISPIAAAENIISTMADSLLLLDREGNIISVNKATLDLLGYRENELEGKSIEMLFTDKDFRSTLLDKAIKKEVIRNYELDFRTKTKNIISTLFSSSTAIDEAGGMVGIVCIIKDITNRKAAEMAIVHEQNLLHALMDNVPDFIYFKDEKNRFVRVNKKSAEDRGVRPEDFIGKTDFDIFTEEAAKKCFADDNRVMKTGKPLINKIEKITYLNGVERWFSATKVPRYDEKGKTRGLIGVSRDITERIQNEKLQQVLFNISKAANSPISLDELYQSIHQELGLIIDVTNFYIALLDQEEDKILFPYNADYTKAIHLSRSINHHSLVSEVIKTGIPLLVNQERIKKNKTLMEFKEWFGTLRKIWLGVPLKVKDRIIGAIVVQSYTNPELYSEKDIGLLEFASSQIATALERKKAEDNLKKSQQEFASLFTNSPEALVYLDEKGVILNINPRFTKLFGYTLKEIKGRNLDDGMIHPSDKLEEGKRLTQRSSKGYVNYETVRKRKDDTLFPVSISGSNITINGHIKGLLATYIDITERKILEEKLEKLAYFDILTGCYARGYGLSLLERQIKLAQRHKTSILLLYVDLDGLKYINDTFGHKEGDKTLKEAAKFFKFTLRDIDIVCRMGGDEFLLVFPDSSLNDVLLIKERITDKLNELNENLSNSYQLSFSIGFSCYNPSTPLSIKELIKIADENMYEEKKRKGRVY